MEHAVVLGGSIAGMCAAAALVPHVRRVTLVERDALPTGPAPRRGVPQSQHVHALLVRGRRELDRLLPGFDHAMRAGGALDLDFGTDFASLRPNGWAVRAPCGLRTLWASRELLESVVRDLLRAGPTDVVTDTCDGLCIERGRVTGARLRAGGDLAADLVVDATGRGSKLGAWLAAAGHPPPPVDEVDPRVGYASRRYRIDPARWHPDWWFRGLWIDGVPPDLARGGVAFPIEGDQLQVTAIGFAGDLPPGDDAGFHRFLASLRSPLLAEVVGALEPVSDLATSRSMANRFHHYEAWPAALPGVVAVGDAVCAFNPAYGQGMTAAAVSAHLLGRTVGRGGDPDRIPHRFHRAQAKFLAGPWGLAVGADFVWPGTLGTAPRGTALGQRWTWPVFETATFDPELLAELVPIFHLLASPRRFLHPWVVWRVARATAARRRARRDNQGAAPPLPPG